MATSQSDKTIEAKAYQTWKAKPYTPVCACGVAMSCVSLHCPPLILVFHISNLILVFHISPTHTHSEIKLPFSARIFLFLLLSSVPV